LEFRCSACPGTRRARFQFRSHGSRCRGLSAARSAMPHLSGEKFLPRD
jgi:hypothetical protein